MFALSTSQFGPDSPIFDILTRQLGEVPEWEDKTVLKSNISLHDVLPTVTSSFYRYDGSFTTPGCKESVIWTVFDQPITISPRQVGILIFYTSKFDGAPNAILYLNSHAAVSLPDVVR